MTQEQYKRAVEISEQIEELEQSKLYLREMEFRYNCCRTDYAKRIISKFRIMACTEIDNEIENLKKEIEEL